LSGFFDIEPFPCVFLSPLLLFFAFAASDRCFSDGGGLFPCRNQQVCKDTAFLSLMQVFRSFFQKKIILSKNRE